LNRPTPGLIYGGKNNSVVNPHAVVIGNKGEVIDLKCAANPANELMPAEVLPISKVRSFQLS
jgi:hypothetical protein